MQNSLYSLSAVTLLVAAAGLFSSNARAFELSGAWASQPELCGQVFTRKGNEVLFAEMSDLYGSGFVIDGKRIRGKAAQCTILSTKQDGSDIELAAACASTIMTQNVQFSLKVLDDNTISRAFSEVPGMTIKYSRCKL
jgi:hypothetical protein